MERNRHNAPQGSAPEPRPVAGPGSGAGDAVASRRTALESLGSTLPGAPGAGPVLLLTGEAGAGKTWLRKRLVDRLPEGWRAAVVEVAPTIDAVDFLTLAAARLGAACAADRPATLRIALAEALEDDAREGRPWLLVVEQAQHASAEVWAEIEALCDGLHATGGFAGVVLVGRTDLARRLASRPLRPVASRLAKHVHLPPLDVDEAARLLAGVDASEVERLHRDAAGNPRRLLALAGDRASRALAPVVRREVLAPAPAVPADRPVAAPVEPSAWSRPAPRYEAEAEVETPNVQVEAEVRPAPAPLLPSRPPLRIEDGLIEVGWEGSFEAEESAESETSVESTPADGELVEDHYAALQAWTEWARNRDRLSRGVASEAVESVEDQGVEDAEIAEVRASDTAEAGDDFVAEESDAEDDEESPLGEDLRAEPRHEHAPYSQLFTKLRQSS
ncbi:ATP-binding protein [Paludisphaera soli]|uniref:ATP-binding protein n=1 Tax=Paludisphaera soli TaxID=2712865 RepID=UPI0013EA8D3C|nr:ATP-binding protein [Paludisphaera soli]